MTNKVKLTNEILFEAIGSISEDMLLKSEQSLPKKEQTSKRILTLGVMAASLLLICGALILSGILSGPNRYAILGYDGPVSTGSYSETLSGGDNCYPSTASRKELKHLFDWKTVYNLIDTPKESDESYPSGYFTENLDLNAVTSLLPSAILSEGDFTGKATFNKEGELLNVTICVDFHLYDQMIYATISKDDIRSAYLSKSEATKSICNNIEYVLYKYSDESYFYYEADAEINGLYYNFSIKTTKYKTYNAEKYLKYALERFASYNKAPDLSKIEPTALPSFEDKELSLSEAQSDEIYGSFIPANAPSGFDESSFKRYIDGSKNYLSAHWYKGLDYIDIKVIKDDYYDIGYYSRVVSIDENEKYDLRLYPIPRAESVPEELLEVVENPIFDIDDLNYDIIMKRSYSVEDSGDTDSLRMKFTVSYHSGQNGTYFVEINAKGADPFWILETLQSFR